MEMKEKLNNLKDLILEIFTLLKLKHDNPSNFNNLATKLYENSLISSHYYHKIKSLDSYLEKQLELPELLKNEIDNIRIYLEMRFYHYI